MRRGWLVLIGALACVLVGASSAAAATFCVNPVAGQTCSGTSEPDLQTALNTASAPPYNTQPNAVIVGDPGTPPAGGYTYSTPNPATNPVSIIGAGQGTTTLTDTSGGAMLVVSGDGSSVSNLTISIPAAGSTGLVLIGATANKVTVTSPAPQTNGLTGVELLPGSTSSAPLPTFTGSNVSFPTSGTGGQVFLVAEVGALIEDDGFIGLNAAPAVVFTQPPSGYPNGSTLRRVTMSDTSTSAAVGMEVVAQTVAADNVAISLPGTGLAGGAVVDSASTADSTLDLNQVGIYGDADASPTPNSFGVEATSSNAGRAATINVRNSIIRNFFFATQRNANTSGASANVRYDYSDYDFIHRLDNGGTGAITNGIGNLNDADPQWLNPAAGDFRIPSGSPVVNAGDPAPLNPALESTTDVLGNPRISGGRRDMGAVEYQFPLPPPPPKFPAPTLSSQGRFNPKTGKVSLSAICNESASGSCALHLTLKGTVSEVTHKHGHKHHKKVTVTIVLTGTIAGGTTGTLTGHLTAGQLRAIGTQLSLSMSLTGTATDTTGTFPLSERVKLVAEKVKKKKHHHH